MIYKQRPGKEQDISHRGSRRAGKPSAADGNVEAQSDGSVASLGASASSDGAPGAAGLSKSGSGNSGSAVPRRKNVTAKGADAHAASGDDASRGEPTGGDAPRVQYLLKLAGNFHAVLDACAAHPEVEAVHRVRTGSRRVQALVEILLRDAGRAATVLEKPANQWLRQMKKTRRAAGVVRDLDVHRKLLEKSLGAGSRRQKVDAAKTAETVPEAESALVLSQETNPHGPKLQGGQMPSAQLGVLTEGDPFRVQALKLGGWLKDKRDGHAEDLQKEIRKRRERLVERQSEFFAALGQRRGHRTKPPAAGTVALNAFVRVMDEFPSLDSGNLHDFRKETKKARYVAESDAEDQEARTVAQALKRVQDVIGDWHDWQCLTEEADAALGEEGTEVRVWLKVRADRSLRHALKITEEMRGRLLGEWLAMGGSRRSTIARKQPRGDSPVLSVSAMNR